jgi:hypothetical protein
MNENGDGRLKKMPVDFGVLMYLVERFGELYRVAINNGYDLADYANAYYGLARRSLYEHLADAVFMLLLALAQLKNNHKSVLFGSEGPLVE